MIHLSMSVGHSFALVKTVKLLRRRMIVPLQLVSGFIASQASQWHSAEHFIDLVNWLPAVAGRMARPERRLELRALAMFSRLTASGPAPGLARQVLKRELEGLEPAGEALRH